MRSPGQHWSHLLDRGSPALRAGVVFALLVALWAPDALLGLDTYWHHDLRTHHYPWRVWAAGRWLAGELPLWCAGAANGYPLLADGQTGVLYPPTMLLFALLPGPLAMAWSVLLHHWWAGVGATMLARRLGRSGHAALLAGVAYCFGGFLVTHTLYLGMMHALAWLPFTLLAVVEATRGLHGGEPGTPRRWWAAAGLGLGLMALAGHIQGAVFSWLLVGMVTLWRVWPQHRTPKGALRPLLGFTAAAMGAMAVASPQLVASMELSRFSMREGGVAAAFAGIGSLPPWELINGVLPRFFGIDRPADIALSYHHRGTGYWGMGENHWEMAFYLGIPVVVLASWALWRRRERFWWAVAGLAMLLMLGRFTPAWDLFRLLPGMGYFRFPVRFAIWLVPAVALLAASGLDDLTAVAQDQPARPRRWLAVVTLITLLGFGGLASLNLGLQLGEPAVRGVLTGHFMAQTQLPPPPADLGPLEAAAMPAGEPEDPALVPAKVERIIDSLRQATSPASSQVLWPVLQVALLLGGVALVRRRRLSSYGFGMGAVALLLVDLHSFGGDYHPRVPSSFAEAEPSALQLMDADRDRYRVSAVHRQVDTTLDTELASSSLGLLWGLQDVIITSPLLVVRNEAVLGLAGLDLGTSGPAAKLEALQEHLPIASFLGVRYLLSTHDLQDPRLLRLRGGPVKLYRNLDAQPLATAVGCVVVAASPDAAFEGLQRLHPGDEVVVEPAEGHSLPAELTACTAPGPAGTVEILDHGDRDWSITATMDRPGMLVLAETHYPGWLATVDGEPVPIHTANLAFRGIELGPGEHRVTLRYQPRWLRPTLLLAGLALLLGMAAALWPRKRERFSRS
jgi:hypothetical protein